MTEPAIIPRPTEVTRLPGELLLTERTTVDAPPQVAGLLRILLGPATGLALPPAGGPGPQTISLRVVESTLTELGTEGYRLEIDDRGVRGVAASATGLVWAVQTLRQLLPPQAYARQAMAGVRWTLPCLRVVDTARLPWRGALLDVARWCHPIEFLHEFVDLLAVHKLNTLHLHLTDDQGWRFEVRKYPRLAEVGGRRTESPVGHRREGRFDGVAHGGYYTQDELRDLVGYAAQRGVRVMPEIDLPGHVQAAVAAYPWLGNDPRRQLPVRTTWGMSSHVLNTDDATVDFMRDVLDEVMSVFEFEYVHLGGDEVPLTEWAANPRALARVAQAGLAGPHELVGWWIDQMGAHLAGHGRKIAVWDEVVEARPSASPLVFAWRSQDRVSAALAAGHRVIAVPQEYVYLDRPESLDPAEPVSIGGHTPLARTYGYEPMQADLPGRVLGTQGMLWAEYMPTPHLVQWRAFPRLAAIAEVGWSHHRDETSFRHRLPAHLLRLDQLGVHYHNLDVISRGRVPTPRSAGQAAGAVGTPTADGQPPAAGAEPSQADSSS